MKITYDTLTLTFEIKDKEKFRIFHSKMFPSKPSDEQLVIDEIGARAIVSSWSNPHDEINILEKALEYALDRLVGDDYYFCEGLANGKTLDELEIDNKRRKDKNK